MRIEVAPGDFVTHSGVPSACSIRSYKFSRQRLSDFRKIMKSRNYRSQVAQPALRPVVTVDDITDPTAAGENFELLDQDAVQLEAGAFRARRVAVRLAGSTVVYQSTYHRLRVRTRVPPGLVAILTLGPRSRGSLDGLALRPELLLAGEPGVEVEFVVEPRYESVGFLLSPEELIEHLRARGRADDFRVPHGVEMWHHGTIGVRGLYELGKRMTETAARNPELFDASAQAHTAAHIEVLESLMAALGTGEALRPTRRDTRSITGVRTRILCEGAW